MRDFPRLYIAPELGEFRGQTIVFERDLQREQPFGERLAARCGQLRALQRRRAKCFDKVSVVLEDSEIFQPLRLALTGLTVSPGIFDVLQTLGRQRSVARIDAAIRYITKRDAA